MTTSIVISILYVVCLTCSVAPRAIGLVTAADKPTQQYFVSLVFGVTQGLMALLGMLLGEAVGHLFLSMGKYLVFFMMLVVVLKLFIDAMKILKGKMLYTFTSDWGFVLLGVIAAMNTFLMSLTGKFFLPFGMGFVAAVSLAGFVWAVCLVKRPFHPNMIKTMSFIEFAASAFLLVIALLFMFSNVFVL